MATRTIHPPITIGQRFERLLVIEEASPYIWKCHRHRRWKCQCDCGNVIVAHDNNLKRRTVLSCGCWTLDRLTKHGHNNVGKTTKTYRAWQAMKSRCYNQKVACYDRYGGRGIRVCDRWLESFENFLSDMGECPPGLSLDRLDNSGNYEPENCEWRSRVDQTNNRRSNVYIEWQGKKMTLADAARFVGLPYYVVRSRISDHGWSSEKALTTPVAPNGGRYIKSND
jgi:hypothetical protein